MVLQSQSQAWEVQELDDGTLVKVTHRDLDAGTAMLLFDDLLELAHESCHPNLFLDFGGVDYLSSAVLGRLILLDRRLRDAGGRLSLFSLNPQVKELLYSCRFDDLLDVRGIPLPRPQPATSTP
jgi:anti-sigma B factor antagonist